MEDQAVRLAQYAAFGAARLHFSRLFFQTTAFVLAAMLLAVVLFRDIFEPLRTWVQLSTGFALIQASFIVSRLQRQERSYEELLNSIESSFNSGLSQPRSGRFGAKTSVVIVLCVLGLLLLLQSAVKLTS